MYCVCVWLLGGVLSPVGREDLQDTDTLRGSSGLCVCVWLLGGVLSLVGREDLQDTEGARGEATAAAAATAGLQRCGGA